MLWSGLVPSLWLVLNTPHLTSLLMRKAPIAQRILHLYAYVVRSLRPPPPFLLHTPHLSPFLPWWVLSLSAEIGVVTKCKYWGDQYSVMGQTIYQYLLKPSNQAHKYWKKLIALGGKNNYWSPLIRSHRGHESDKTLTS